MGNKGVGGARVTFIIAVALLLTLAAVLILVKAATFSFSPDPNGQTFLINESTIFYYDLNVTIGDAEVNYSVEAQTFFSNLTVDKLTGLIAFRPTNGEVTNNSVQGVTFLARKKTNQTDVALTTMLFNVTNVNDPPNITTIYPTNTNVSVVENVSVGFIFNYTASDPDIIHGDGLASFWYVDGLLRLENQTQFNYTTSYCDAGNHNITLIVRDNDGLTDRKYWNATVNNSNRAPFFNLAIPNFVWDEDSTLQEAFNLSVHLFDNDTVECTGSNQDVLNYSYVFVTNNADNYTIIINETTKAYNVTFIPDANFSGNATVYFRLSDGTNTTASNNLSLNVTNINDGPFISQIPNSTTAANVTFYFDVNASDPDLYLGDILSYYDNTSIFEINQSTGIINFSYAGTDNFSILIWVNDSAGLNYSVIWNLSIAPNNAPVLAPIGDLSMLEDSLFVYNVTASDADGHALTFLTNDSLFTLIAFNSSQAYFSLTPTNSDVGNYSVRVTVQDILGSTDSEVITLAVNNTNDAPTVLAIPSPQTVTVNTTYYYDVNASDPDQSTPYGDVLLYWDNATVFEINRTTGVINFTPTDSNVGNYSITIVVNDTAGANDSATFILQVLQQSAPSFISPISNISVNEDQQFRINITASDPNSDALNFTINSSGSVTLNVTTLALSLINNTDAYIQFTPLQYDIGAWVINFTVRDVTNLSDIRLINITVSAVNDTPVLGSVGNLTMTEDSLFTHYLYAADEENDTLSFGTNVTFFNITTVNSSIGLINVTPTNDQVGNYSILINVTDGNSNDSEIINLTVVNTPDAPTIDAVSPSGASASLLENTTLNFTLVTSDADVQSGDTLTYLWYRNGTLSQSGLSNYSFNPNFCEAAVYNLTVVVQDSTLNNVSNTWIVTVNNSNRPPRFGYKTYYNESDFIQGTFNQTNASRQGGKVILANNSGSGYHLSGTYVSPAIDIGYNSNNEDTVVFLTLNWSQSLPAGTNLSIQTRTSADASSWSSYGANHTGNTPSVGAPFVSAANRYVQYRVTLSTNNTNATPELHSVSIYYKIPSFNLTEGVVATNKVILDRYFFDPDRAECSGQNIDNLTYTSTGNNSINVTYSYFLNQTRVTFNPGTGFTGSEDIYFVADDGHGNTTASNNFTLDVNKAVGGGNTVTIIQTGGGGGGGSRSTTTIISQPKDRDKDKPIALNIISPQKSTLLENDLLIVPIRISNNNENFKLTNVRLEAFVNASNVNVTFKFDRDTFPELAYGDEYIVNLTVTSHGVVGSYEILVKATSENPEFEETAVLYISGIELGTEDLKQYNTRVIFARDLLQQNPECLELSEGLSKAEAAIRAGSPQAALDLIDAVIDNCRYLTSLSEQELNFAELQSPTVISRLMRLLRSPGILLTSIALLLVFLTIIAYLLYINISDERKLREAEKKRKL
ncbi:hypothetical protein J4475_01935 [Candidatus Woesearchaeota archaeon]|nr:hypothetical protein [Candidatus Woesearchaeota archaeon]